MRTTLIGPYELLNPSRCLIGMPTSQHVFMPYNTVLMPIRSPTLTSPHRSMATGKSEFNRPRSTIRRSRPTWIVHRWPRRRAWPHVTSRRAPRISRPTQRRACYESCWTRLRFSTSTTTIFAIRRQRTCKRPGRRCASVRRRRRRIRCSDASVPRLVRFSIATSRANR